MRQAPSFSPSLMCADLMNVGPELNILDKRVDAYHVDIMDGHFCPNITLSPDFIRAVTAVSDIPVDAHMMVTDPIEWVEPLVEAGATWISPHAETINTNAFRLANLVESLGAKTGVVLNPATPLSWIEMYLDRIDLLTLMTVDVGFAGQPFIEQVLPKIEDAASYRDKHGLDFTIQIDGSCNKKTFKRLWEAGADRFIVGSSGLWSRDTDLARAYDVMMEDFAIETGVGVD